MPGIIPEERKRLKWKSLTYLLRHDKKWALPRYFFKRPFRYGFNLLKSYLKGKAYRRENDFFYYNLEGKEHFKKELNNPGSLILLGFSYCHKPFECPSGRFSDRCKNDPLSPVCGQCFIGKMQLLSSPQITTLFIPTVHYIGEKMLELTAQNPTKKLLFLITACEMTLEMFGDWGNMIGARGIGVRLDGRICNTMKAFELSERGIKPGLTVVTEKTQKEMLELFNSLV